MAKNIFVIYRYRRRVSTQIYQRAASSLLRVSQYAVCQGERCQVHFCDRNVGFLKTSVNIVVEILFPQDIEENTFQMIALYADRVYLILVIYLIFLCRSIQDLLIRICHVAVDIHQLINHFLSYDGCGR